MQKKINTSKRTKRLTGVLALSSLLTVGYIMGPRVTVDESIRPVELPSDLDNYLLEKESPFANIIPGAEKTIIWAHPSQKEQTEYSIVYLHGFSATRQETAPLSDSIAAALGANLYYGRLAGHGQDGNSLAEATANDWLNDAVEALEIGKRLGRKVVLIGTSTGGTLATWLAARRHDLFALVLISPNFGPKNARAEILLKPWAKYILPWIAGKERSWQAQNELHERYWTTRYPFRAVFPMMGLIQCIRELDLAQIRVPALVIYAAKDEVVDAKKTEMTVARFGSLTKEIVVVNDVGDGHNHVLAGDILSPDGTSRTARRVLDFLEDLEIHESPGKL